MANGRQQGKELHRPTIGHGGAGKQPGGPQTGMAGQPEKGLGAPGREVLGEVGLIGQKDATRGGQLSGQARPAVELQGKPKGQGLLPPVGMQSGRRHHHHPAIGQAHHRPCRGKGGERFPQTHGIG